MKFDKNYCRKKILSENSCNTLTSNLEENYLQNVAVATNLLLNVFQENQICIKFHSKFKINMTLSLSGVCLYRNLILFKINFNLLIRVKSKIA